MPTATKKPIGKVILRRQPLPEWATCPEDMLFRRKEKSLWQFWRDGITSSFLYNFLNCLEQTRLIYVGGWTSRQTPLALEFGQCMHWCFEHAYQDADPASEERCIQLVKQYEQVWLSNVPAPTPKQLEQQELVYGMAEIVLPQYFLRWEGDFTGSYRYHNNTAAPREWVSLEQNFCIPYTYPDGRVTYLRGKRDGVFRDKRGQLWVFDTKCRSVINHEEALETLPFDAQQMLYLHAAEEDLGIKATGTIMNIVRRPGHRRGVNESLAEFLARMRKDVSNPKKYDHNYTRYQMTIGRNEVREWKTNFLDPCMMAVRLWWEGVTPHYLNPNALTTKYGRCGMFLPIVKNEFALCYQRQHAFNELADI